MRLSDAAAAVSLLPLLALGCNEGPPTPAPEQPFAAICNEANEGRRVAVRGYLRLPDSNRDDYSIMLRMYETPSFSGAPIGINMRFGDKPHHLTMVPTSYTDNDLRVHLADGSTAGFGAPVKVSGEVYVPLVGQDFACGLSDLYVEAA